MRIATIPGRTSWCVALSLVAAACSPARDAPGPPQASTAVRPAGGLAGMRAIPAGTFRMGSADGAPDERPVRGVAIDAFRFDVREVTHAEFSRFVSATGYVTDAERWGWSAVFDPAAAVAGHEGSWWRRMDGANWKRPRGAGSTVEAPDALPVVQVSWHDALAYCTWAGKRLPTEAEWEYAARGGLGGEPFTWGSAAHDRASHANTWDGVFPTRDEGLDGHAALAPVGRFPPNGYGLHDMAGNAWEWVADWYSPTAYRDGATRNPSGPRAGTEKVLRGGSWLCADNYCRGWRVAHRNKATPDSAWDHTGFRCATTSPAG
jgi:formylglycine-generating enzyme required for sulfatase activity